MENNQALPDSSVVVISPQYCVPYQVDLYTAKRVKKITEGMHLGVFDINGSNIFKVKPASGFLTSRLNLVDAAGLPVMSLKPVAFSQHSRWNVYRGDSSESKDVLFTVKLSKIFQSKTNLDVFLASNTAQDVCDFKIKQRDSKTTFIYRGDSDNIIAEMHMNKAVRDKVRGKETSSVTVYPNVDYAFVIAMLGALDEINTPPSSGGKIGLVSNIGVAVIEGMGAG
ncbi:hypothetical protein MKW94_005518 [Papaver nudicaule]|uniref:Protein LURP-one-related 15 n=1 Tax=Papaver nudicaule TaxID=74823 RepID=A0AA41VYY2_PAPNU|nr:hypothetical protein [Papaver nudicaule]MCL7049804.1 hypothetical protein [Papaver nudicaule]